MLSTPPDGWLKCDGSKYSKDTYEDLFNILITLPQATRTTWGNANWTTEFNVPNLQGEFLRGTGTNSHSQCGSGSNVGIHQKGTLQPNYRGWSNNGTETCICAEADENGSGKFTFISHDTDYILTKQSYFMNISYTKYLGPSSRDTHFSSRPTNTSVLYCIKY